jgi:hypothetical protein
VVTVGLFCLWPDRLVRLRAERGAWRALDWRPAGEWLKPRLWLAALLGAVAGPLSFRAGAALGALRFSRPLPALLTLGAGWMVLLPLLIVLSRRFNGVRPRLAHSLSGDGKV